ncbi:MAG: hypothetical protein JWO08_4378 [Verrucomicrobiaceae bacterium]|nr:hypothetical protein [Verrucomicrobiaceae bacterium]
MNPQVDAYLSKAKTWREETEKLRTICLGCGLTEELKWGKPCYSFQESNVVIIQGFKDCCALLFCKGALLKDAKDVLKKPGENTQAARRMEFTSAEEITKLAPLIKAFIREAMEVEEAGLEVTYKKPEEYTVPEEFQKKMDAMPALKKAFTALTPGRQRFYLMHFSSAKQAKTREARIEKCIQPILDGKG